MIQKESFPFMPRVLRIMSVFEAIEADGSEYLEWTLHHGEPDILAASRNEADYPGYKRVIFRRDAEHFIVNAEEVFTRKDLEFPTCYGVGYTFEYFALRAPNGMLVRKIPFKGKVVRGESPYLPRGVRIL